MGASPVGLGGLAAGGMSKLKSAGDEGKPGPGGRGNKISYKHCK